MTIAILMVSVEECVLLKHRRKKIKVDEERRSDKVS